MKCLLFFLSFLSFSLARARVSDGKTHVALKDGELVCHVDKGFHFNKEAPANLKSDDGRVDEKPRRKEEVELVFDTAHVEKKSFTLNFYVCDDGKTVCEEHNERFRQENGRLLPVSGTALDSTVGGKSTASKTKVSRDKNGFIEDNFAAAVTEAHRKNQLILVDFNAPWCPACLRLQTETFPQKIFQRAATRLVKLSLNVDLPENKELSDRYGIKAIPTLLVINTEGNEIYRTIDYKPAGELAAELRDLFRKKTETYQSLRLEAEAGSEPAMYALGLRAYNALDYAEAVKWLSSLRGHQKLFANSEVSYWSEQAEKDEKNKKAYIAILEKWITLLPDSYEAIVWRNEWARQLSPEAKNLPAKVRDVLQTNMNEIQAALASTSKIRKLFSDPYQGDYRGFEKAELNSQLAESEKMLGDATAQARAQRAVLASFEGLHLSTQKPGQLLMALHYLSDAGQTDEVGDWYEKLVKAYPDNYVYYMKLARFYCGQKAFEKALPLQEKAIDLGPEMALYNLKQLAEIQSALHRKEDAQKTIDRALALPEAKSQHNKKIADALETMKKNLR